MLQEKTNAEIAKLEKLRSEKRQPPSYWQRKFAEKSSDGFALVPLDQQKDQVAWRALERLLDTDGSQLGKGRDAQPGRPYNRLKLATAWRFEHPTLWEAYMAGERKVVEQMKRIKSHGKPFGTPHVKTSRASG